MTTLYPDPMDRRPAAANRSNTRVLREAAWSGWSPESFLGVLAAVSGSTVAGRFARQVSAPTAESAG